MSTNNRTLTIDLTLARANVKIAEPGDRVTGVYLSKLDAGAVIQVAAGFADPITFGDLIAGGKLCPPETEGVYLTNAAQPGLTCEIVIAYGGLEAVPA